MTFHKLSFLKLTFHTRRFALVEQMSVGGGSPGLQKVDVWRDTWPRWSGAQAGELTASEEGLRVWAPSIAGEAAVARQPLLPIQPAGLTAGHVIHSYHTHTPFAAVRFFGAHQT